MKGRIGAYAALTGGFILAGSSVVSGKMLAALPVFFAASGGAAISLLALVPLALGEGRPDRGAMARALPLLAAQAFFGVALFRVLMLAALARTGASEAGVGTSVTPVITALLAALFLGERIGWRPALGVGVAAAGIAVLEGGGRAAAATLLDFFRSPRFAGCALALGAAASESVFNILSKRLDSSIGPRRASAVVMAMAFALLAGLSIVSRERVAFGALGPREVLAFAYQGLFASALAYILWFTGVKRVPASTAGVFSGFMPLAAFALSAIVLGERPGPASYLGAALTIAGILLCAWPRSFALADARLLAAGSGKEDRA